MTIQIEDEPQTEELTLEVGETYENGAGELFTFLGNSEDYADKITTTYTYIFVARATGIILSLNLLTAKRLKKLTPPVEVKPVWVFIYADGDTALSYSCEELLNCVTEAELASGQVHRIPLTWEPGRRDDLEASDE